MATINEKSAFQLTFTLFDETGAAVARPADRGGRLNSNLDSSVVAAQFRVPFAAPRSGQARARHERLFSMPLKARSSASKKNPVSVSGRAMPNNPLP